VKVFVHAGFTKMPKNAIKTFQCTQKIQASLYQKMALPTRYKQCVFGKMNTG
jgi:hypothetical protein